MKFHIAASPEATAMAMREGAVPIDSLRSGGSGPIWPERLHLGKTGVKEIAEPGVTMVAKHPSNSAIGKTDRSQMVSGFYCSALLVALPLQREAYVEIEVQPSKFGGSNLRSDYQLEGPAGGIGTGDHASWLTKFAIKSAVRPWAREIAKRAQELDRMGPVVPKQTGLNLLVDSDGKVCGVLPEL